ncbi:FAD-linked oxidase C-terminal domain-containing protein [Prauserella halophila]|uniref:FAD-linked oxidase C-terminal domain-containing protein n=2 Tax=Prauserella halophila TaxID=185641 RepID=A0ABN1WCC5_9PSEU
MQTMVGTFPAGTAAGLVDLLTARLGSSGVLTDPDVMANYSRDRLPLAPSGTPLAVALPSSTEEVQAVVRACADAGVPVVPRGAGSGLCGGANALDGCVVLVLTRMNRIVEVDAANRVAVVEPGVINADLREAATAHDLFYPPDPASYDFCTLGGNLATNAGGLCCVKYGVTTDSVLGLDVVLADGSLLQTGRRTVKGVAGYDLTKLFVGSEGTLGVITRATLALRPLPQVPGTLVASFPDTADAGAAVTRIVGEGLVPSLMEIMDATTVRTVERYLGTDLGSGDGGGTLLLCQSDAGGEAASRELAVLERVCSEAGAALVHSTTDLAEGSMLMQARRSVHPAIESMGAQHMIDDVCVPRTRIADLIDGCARIAEDVGLRIVVNGHAGDGNMHPTVIYDRDDEFDRARGAFDAICELGLSLGGTVSGEHGIGKFKQDLLARELGPVGLRVHRDIRRSLDPHNLFNPGSMFE